MSLINGRLHKLRLYRDRHDPHPHQKEVNLNFELFWATVHIKRPDGMSSEQRRKGDL